MIGKLKGRIDSIEDDSVLLDLGGVGYHVFCSARTLAALPGVGAAAELITETHVREDHIHLYGFPDATERRWFRELMTVQGVGVKMAMAILGVFAPAQLITLIAAKDTKTLTRVSGVGAKLAERITTELKNKVAKLPLNAGARVGTPTTLPPATADEDAISALVHLGYSRAQAYGAVVTASGKLGESGKVDTLIKESLRALAR